jgi:uncharacterized membrane protein
MGRAGRHPASGRVVSRWWSGSAERGDSARLEAFSDGVLAIAITLLILDVRVEQQPGQSLASALSHAGPELLAYAASFLQIGIMWANHHTLFRIVERVDQLLLLANLLLLGFIAFLPLPTMLVAQHTSGNDARTAMLLYGATITGCALAFNLIWQRAVRKRLLMGAVSAQFRRDVDIRYVAGLIGYIVATLLAFVAPWLTVAVSVALALLFLLGPSTRSPIDESVDYAPTGDPHESRAPR